MKKSTPEPQNRRQAHKQQRILHELQQQLVDNSLKPGDRLATRPELARRFGVSSLTIQRVLDRLVDQGFLSARPRLGTFVCPHPPHLAHYGIVFDRHPDLSHLRWSHSRFWTAVASEAGLEAQQRGGKAVIYTDVGNADSPAKDQLLADIRDRRLAGLVLTNPYALQQALADWPIPVTAFMRHHDIAGLICIQFDVQQWLSRALDDMVAAGRQRIALIVSESTHADVIRYFRAGVVARGMTTAANLIHGLSYRHPHWANACAQVILATPPALRPDGLIITDDHLAEHAAQGVVEAGVRCPSALRLVVNCNHGWSAPLCVEARKLGYVPRQLLQQSFDLIDRHNRGDRSVFLTRPTPLFEDEFTSSAAAGPAAVIDELQEQQLPR